MIPPITSDMTLGWRSFDNGHCSKRQKMMIMLAWLAACQSSFTEGLVDRTGGEATNLNNEEDNWIFCVEFGGVQGRFLEDTTLRRGSVSGARSTNGRRRLGDELRDDLGNGGHD